MKITHHIDDATVVAYAAATLPEAHMILVASHLAYCSHCRIAVRRAEAFGGELMMEQPEAPVSDMCRSATLASLDAIQPAKVSRKENASNLPMALARMVEGMSLEELPWKKKGPGLSVYEVPMAQKSNAKLMFLNIAPGRAMPEHGHGGEELTLVLKGSYADRFGRFCAGDIADLDEEVEHKPITDAVEGCICVIAVEAPTVFKPFWARLMQPFIGI